MARYRVLVTDYAWPSLDIERSILDPLDAELLVADANDPNSVVKLAPVADAILTCWRQVPVEALDLAANCRVISRYGIGLDNIPVARATELGMLVTNVPDFCLDEVSDHVMALLLASTRRLIHFANATRSGRWSQKADASMPRLRGKTLGIIGFGNLARALVPKAAAFGLRVIAYTPRLSSDALDSPHIATNDLDLLLRESDFISIHAPLNAETRCLIDEAALRRMKPTALLINTARGAIIDEDALLRALRQGWIAGAALDVLAQEPPPSDHPLLAAANVLVTPHVAFYSEAAIEDLQRSAAENVAYVLRGEQPAQIVNPSVLAQPNLRFTKKCKPG